MNFFSGLFKTGLESNILNYKVDFSKNYGDYNENFTQLDTYGNMKMAGPFIFIFILSVILLIIFFSLSSSGVFTPTTNKILYYIGWFFVIVAIMIMGYGLYLYLFVYLGEHSEWFNSLPADGQREINTINSLTEINDKLKTEERRKETIRRDLLNGKVST